MQTSFIILRALIPLTFTLMGCRAAPASVASAVAPISTVPFASDDPNGMLWGPDTPGIPEPVRGSLGAPLLGPQNVLLDKQNSDFLAPPSTDAGTVYVLVHNDIFSQLSTNDQ